MKIKDSEFREVKIIENAYAYDMRGNFIKIFNEEEFLRLGLNTDFKETYYSTSQKDVIRGMHFQLPPYEHDKMIHVIYGSVIDVIVDLRKESENYKKYIAIRLTGNRPRSLYIPKGFAHGFQCLENNTVMLYQVTTGYQPNCDSGIAYDSIGYDWKVEDPILSERDQHFIPLQEFISPF